MSLRPLLDRDDERRQLEEAWRRAAAGTPQLALLWGRRRVGKTFLLSHFVQDKPAVFFGATEQAEAIELERLAEATRRDLGDGVADLLGGRFASWEAALRFFAALAAERPVCLVIDEAPYLARSTPGFASIVQVVWDRLPPGTRLLLVLAGSAVATMEAMIGAGGPLRGRPSLTLRLDPLDIWAARAFLPRLRAEHVVEAYAACGGYPLHLQAWDQSVGTEANLLRLAGQAGGILLDDARMILREELSESGGYARVLAAIGRGRTRPSQIASEVGQRIERPLDILCAIGMVRRQLPVGAPKGARPSYEIADPYLAFWFRVLYSEAERIEGGQGRSVLRMRRPEWERHVGWVFEEVARAHAIRLAAGGDLPEDLLIGRWWRLGPDPCEIDVLGLRGGQTALIGEARWQRRPITRRDLRELLAKANCAPAPRDDPIVAFWSRRGAEPEVTAAGAKSFDVETMLAEPT